MGLGIIFGFGITLGLGAGGGVLICAIFKLIFLSLTCFGMYFTSLKLVVNNKSISKCSTKERIKPLYILEMVFSSNELLCIIQ